MTDSPQLGAEGVVRVSVFSQGQRIPDTVMLISITVNRAINKIPTAKIVVQDGDMTTGKFDVSDADLFKPGAVVKINAGYGADEETLFDGIVVKHSISITGDNKSRLLVECQDKAVRMTVGRKNANYVDQSDGDIISKLISASGLQADVPSTSITHKALAQHYCSDWDFILTRADANGLLVVVTDGKVSVKPPQTTSAPTLKCSYGADLIEFRADLDARTQWASAQGCAWNMKTQTVVEGGAAASPNLNAQGNVKSADLAKVLDMSSNRLQSAAPMSELELTAWAKAAQVKAGLARVRGNMKFQGSAKALVGGLIEVAGVGERFNGKVFVSAVNHEIAEGNWTTEATFGMSPEWQAERADVIAPLASGLVPGVNGFQIGVVSELHDDPEGENRVLVAVPLRGAGAGGVWARLTTQYASNGVGIFFMPEIGDEVVLGYFGNDPSYPVIIGSLHSSSRPAPYSLQADNNIKAIVTRSKSKIEFNDADKVITVTTPGNNQIILSDKDQSIQVLDQNGNQVTLTASGIFLDSPKDIRINAKGSIAIEAVGKIDITSKADVVSAGLNVKCDAQVAFVGKGNASAELSASGTAVVKGAMVMIN
jgi:Rhs element Vgr protein